MSISHGVSYLFGLLLVETRCLASLIALGLYYCMRREASRLLCVWFIIG